MTTGPNVYEATFGTLRARAHAAINARNGIDAGEAKAFAEAATPEVVLRLLDALNDARRERDDLANKAGL